MSWLSAHGVIVLIGELLDACKRHQAFRNVDDTNGFPLISQR